MAANPIARFKRWFRQAQEARLALPETAALATADRKGRPSVRFVLLKQVDQRGFVFFTNARSRKGKDLHENPFASIAVYWNELGKQVRVDGRVQVVRAAEADAYWVTRRRESQLAALASDQSADLASQRELKTHWRELARKYRGKEVPRPSHWTGFRLVPRAIEFWTRRDHRLHDRELFVRTRQGWKNKLLQP